MIIIGIAVFVRTEMVPKLSNVLCVMSGKELQRGTLKRVAFEAIFMPANCRNRLDMCTEMMIFITLFS